MSVRADGRAGPSGVVTFLLTDIEGSTRRWDADADAMRAALEAHDAVLRNAITRCGGQLFKHTGDGVCAVFSSPRSTVDAAVAAQRSLELPVRMGIATGEAQRRDGDYFGAVLNRAARIMAAGHGGQILLDGQTACLLGGVELEPMGERRLRDIAQPVTVFQVRADGLGIEFPPLRTHETTPGNLHPSPTSFIGRDRDVAGVEAALRAHGLVTLTGAGGVGKTRLALEVAARALADFPDGVWVIELAPIDDPAAVPDAAAGVLGITQQPGTTMANSVAAALTGRRRLLIFDNCEHVLDAAADLIDAILRDAETVRVLATSREGLRLANEQLWPVPALDTRAGVDSTASRLFMDRARCVAPEIALTGAEETGAVVEICRRLDGNPLAIELAASRMISMTAVEIRARLDDRFRLLVGSRRGPEHHHTLRQAVQWSYDLLDDHERSSLARCSVFAGGFDLIAACTVVGDDDEYTTLDVFDALVRKSLLVADRSSRRTRFSMLETIRDFAEDELVASGEADAIRMAHAHYFAGREADVLTLWDGPRQRDAYDWLITELPNLRVAFRWAADHRDLDTAAAIAVCGGFIGGWIELHEPSTWAEQLIESARSVRHSRLAQLYVAASECYRTGRIEEAVRYADAASAAIDTGRFDRSPFDVEPTALGGTYITSGLPDRWLHLCQKRFAQGYGINAFNQAAMVMALTTAEMPVAAMAACADLMSAADATDNPAAVSFAMLGYGYACSAGRPIAAYEALCRGLKIAQDSGNRMIESYIAVNMSAFAATNDDPGDTLDFLALAINNFHDSGSFAHMVSPLGVLATRLDQIGSYEAASTLTGFAATAFARTSYPQIADTITHLREVLGNETYESFAAAGADMTNASVAAYALEQIEVARAELR